jgi:hypothetical protein
MEVVMFRRVDSPPQDEVRYLSNAVVSLLLRATPKEEAPRAAQIFFSVLSCVMGFLHIPKEKVPSRPRLDTLLPAIAAALRARKEFSTLIGMIPLDLIRMQMLLSLIMVGRELLRHAGNFYDLVHDNIALWECEAEEMVFSFHEKAAPFGKDNDDLADILKPIHNHFHGSAERAAETAAKNRELRKEAREAGVKEGEERARGQAREDANKAIFDALNQLRGKIGDGKG